MRILVHFNDKSGCTLHRLILPHSHFADYEITWGFDNTCSKEENINSLADYDILVFHRLLPDGWIEEIKEKFPKLIIIADTDDTWDLPSQHLLYSTYKNYKIDEKIKKHLQLANYVTTTTEILADKIRVLNPNVVVFPNALMPSTPIENPSNKIRLGFIGGVTHLTDMALLEGITDFLPKDVMDKVQFVLCGFDKATQKIVNPDGTITEHLMDWEKAPYVKMEKMLTNNYSIVSPAHKEFLKRYEYGLEFVSDEPYRRIWSKDIWTYMDAYNDIDVLLVPLLDNGFNKYKSELKFIEASAKHKAIIASDVYPYKICAINAINKGGEINPDGNCLLVNNQKGVRGWAKAITKIVRDSDLRGMITTNLSKLTEEGYYNLREQQHQRSNFYYNILNYEEKK